MAADGIRPTSVRVGRALPADGRQILP